jgi:hypothetical protein
MQSDAGEPSQTNICASSSTSPLTDATRWIRPEKPLHAHFDCFSGAAGDMMLAACLDACGDADGLLQHLVVCLRRGLPTLADEFEISCQRVLRSSGRMSALHVTVHSVYDHEAAPVPFDNQVTHYHSHDHNHDQEVHVQNHDHACGDEGRSHNHNHDHLDEASNSGYPLRNLPYIRKLLHAAPVTFIPLPVKIKAITVFTELAKAEATVHGVESIDSVHFHEVGAVDSIVDTVGVLLALDALHVESVSCSRLPLGEGTVRMSHGLMPVPAPATLQLLRDMPTCPGPPGVTGELVTPTAAALLRILSQTHSARMQVGRAPRMTLRRVGIGAGSKDFFEFPNITRLLLGDNVVSEENQSHASSETSS